MAVIHLMSIHLMILGYSVICCQGRCHRFNQHGSNDLWVAPSCESAVHEVGDSVVQLIPKRRIMYSGKIGCARHSFVSCQIPDCLSNPCLHGDCTETLNGYSCRCHDDWTGKLCHIEAPRSLSNNASEPINTMPHDATIKTYTQVSDISTTHTTVKTKVTTPSDLSENEASTSQLPTTKAYPWESALSQDTPTTEEGDDSSTPSTEAPEPTGLVTGKEESYSSVSPDSSETSTSTFTQDDSEKDTQKASTTDHEVTVVQSEASSSTVGEPKGSTDATIATTEEAKLTTTSPSTDHINETETALSTTSELAVSTTSDVGTSKETPVIPQTSESPSTDFNIMETTILTTSMKTEFCSPTEVQSCPDGWITKQDDINKCYQLNTLVSDWNVLNMACCRLSATMLTIESLIEREFIAETFQSEDYNLNLWLGCSNIDGDNDEWSCSESNSMWSRTQGSQSWSGYWPWDINMPDNTASGHRCAFVELSDDDGNSLWKDDDCTNAYRTICQMNLAQWQVAVNEDESDEV